MALSVWTLLGLFFGAQHYLTSRYASQPFSWPQALGLGLGEWYFWGALFPLFLGIVRRFPFERGRWVLSLIVHLPLVLVASLLRVMAESIALDLTGFAPARDPSLLLNSSLLTCGLVLGSAHALGYYRSEVDTLERADGSSNYDAEIASAVDAFRADRGLSHAGSGGSPPGLVDQQAVDLMWSELEAAGEATEMRRIIRGLTAVRR